MIQDNARLVWVVQRPASVKSGDRFEVFVRTDFLLLLHRNLFGVHEVLPGDDSDFVDSRWLLLWVVRGFVEALFGGIFCTELVRASVLVRVGWKISTEMKPGLRVFSGRGVCIFVLREEQEELIGPDVFLVDWGALVGVKHYKVLFLNL